jgi:hypothetical protein
VYELFTEIAAIYTEGGLKKAKWIKVENAH